jgi:hypothetical protein
MTSSPPKRATGRRRSAAPVLLPTFTVATGLLVLAVVAMFRIDSDLADAGVFVLLVVAAGLLLSAIARLLADQEPAAGEDPQDRA